MEKMASLFEDNEFDLELTSRYEYSMVEKNDFFRKTSIWKFELD